MVVTTQVGPQNEQKLLKVTKSDTGEVWHIGCIGFSPLAHLPFR